MGNCLSTSAVCLRREVAIKSGGFSEREDFVTVEDYEYWNRYGELVRYAQYVETLPNGRSYKVLDATPFRLEPGSLDNTSVYFVPEGLSLIHI